MIINFTFRFSPLCNANCFLHQAKVMPKYFNARAQEKSKTTLVTWQQKTLSSTSFRFSTDARAIFSLKSSKLSAQTILINIHKNLIICMGIFR